MQPLGVDCDINTDDLMVAGAGLGEDLSGEKGSAVGGDVPAVLQEEMLEMMHLLAHAFTCAESLQESITHMTCQLP